MQMDSQICMHVHAGVVVGEWVGEYDGEWWADHLELHCSTMAASEMCHDLTLIRHDCCSIIRYGMPTTSTMRKLNGWLVSPFVGGEVGGEQLSVSQECLFMQQIEFDSMCGEIV